MKIKIKYLPGATKLKKIEKGNWIDLYSYKEYYLNKDERYMINLGFAMELPEWYEAIIAPRSSTFKTWRILQCNSIGVVDNSFRGDDDIWHFPAYSVGIGKIEKGDKICQFRIQKIQPNIEFEEVEFLNNDNRGGFGSSGRR